MAVSQQRAGRAERARVGVGERLRRFVREVRSEVRKVVWPSRRELVTYTAVVVAMVLVVAAFLGIIDLIVVQALTQILGIRG